MYVEMQSADTCSSRSTLALAAGAENPERIPIQTKDLESLITAESEMSKKEEPAVGMSSKSIRVVGDKLSTDLHRTFPSYADLRWLVATELRNLKTFIDRVSYAARSRREYFWR